MARTLDQIIAELNPTFQPQVQSLQQQQQLIPQEIQSQETALNAQKDSAYEDIVNGARRRGVGFAGIPLGEQAKYAATTYAPALAGLRQQGQQKAMSLQDAILAINERRDTLGQQIYQTEQQREASERASRAASAAAFSPSYGSVKPTSTSNTGLRVVQSKPGSFAFYNESNAPITAAQYAKATGRELGDVLYEMAQAGDQSAKSVYGILQAEARNNDGGAGYRNALKQLQNRQPQLLGGA